MFRQMIKLRQARKAYDEGRFREAFHLAADPDIAEHLKAVRLRQACLDALGESAAGHARRGELSAALDDVRYLRERGGAAVDAPESRELEERIAERDGVAARARSRFFRARLDAERGDLISARAILDGIRRDSWTEEMTAFHAQIDERIRRARAAIEQALALVEREPKEAENRLEEAARAHPRAEGLVAGWSRLAARRVKAVTKGKIGDPALLTFLTDWALFKRRHLDGGDGAGGDLDRELSAWVRRRVRARLDDDDEPGAALKLVERLREAVEQDAEVEALAAGVAALAAALENIAEGDYAAARKDLERAAPNPGKSRCSRALAAELERQLREFQPRLDEADAALSEGDLPGARRRLLGLLELVPGHREARRRLDGLAERERGRLELLLQLHGDLDKGDLAAARRRVAAVDWDAAADGEIADLLRAIEMESVGRARAREATPPGPMTDLPASAGRPLGAGLMRLSIEEHGELLVVEDDLVTIGAATGGVASLRFLAPLGALHARIERRTGFHAGVSYTLAAEKGRELKVGGEILREPRRLVDGDEIALGRDLRLRFELPVERSRAALLTVLSDHDCEGCHRIALMPPRGRGGALLLGPFEKAHVSTPDLEGEMEIFRETPEAGGDLVAQGPLGLAKNGDEARARVVLEDLAAISARDLVVHVRVLPGGP